MKYTIVFEDSVVDLVKSVNSAIETGWTPLGGPFSANRTAFFPEATRPQPTAHDGAGNDQTD